MRLKLQNNVFYSDSRVLNVGAPQGTCVSPALFTIYTDSCRSQSENVHIIKFADDTAIQGMIKEDNDLSDYIREIDSFCTSCKEHSLQLNISKTKELIIDFSKEGGGHESIVIDGQNVEQVQSYKYLGLTIEDSLDLHIQTSNVISKINQRMFFIRKLNAFRIDKYLISLFYRSVIESIVSFCIYVYGGNALCKDIKKIEMIIKHASRITHISQHTFHQIFRDLSVKKLKRILKEPSHHFFNKIIFSKFSGRFVIVKANRERYRNSFLPYSIRQLYEMNVRMKDVVPT